MKYCSFIFSLALFLILMTGSIASASAPLCHQVFMPDLTSSTGIFQVIQELAEMKLELDTSQASGKASEPIQVLLKSQYPKLLAEVVRSQRGSFSEKEIASMIKQAIHDLQEKVRTEKRQAEVQKEMLLNMAYTLKEAGTVAPLSLLNSTSGSFFLPERETIYAVRGESLHATDFEGRDSIIVPAEAMTILDNGASLLLKKDDKLMTVTTDNNQVRSSYEITFRSTENAEASFESLEVSSDGNYALMKGQQPKAPHRNISVVDLKNHNEVFHHEKLSAKATDAVFIGKNQIAVLYEKEKIEIVEIPSGKVIQSRKVTLDEQGQTAKIAVSKNGARIAVFNDIEILSFLTQDLSLEPRSLKLGKDSTRNRYVTQASGYPHHLLEADYGSGGRLIDLETMTVDFEFQGKYSQENNLFRFVPSPDGKIILAHYSQQDGIKRRYKIDMWEKDFHIK